MMSCIYLVTLLTYLALVNAELPLQDATVTVDQLFHYKLSPADFPQQKIQVTESGQTTLPSWLEFDSDSNELIGVPTSHDKGTYILDAGKEMFAVTVVEPSKNQVAQPINSDDDIVCKPHDSITVVYVKLNADAVSLPATQKSRLVRSISAHLSLKPNHISISAKPKDLLETGAALVSGTGDSPPSENGLSVLSWIVGCGPVKSHHMDILEKLEGSSKDGSMGKLLMIPVNGWQVQSNQPRVVSKRRLKRMVITATPSPESSATGEDTTTMSSSGDGPSPTTDVVTPSMTTDVVTSSITTQQPVMTTAKPTPVPENMRPELDINHLPQKLEATAGQLVRWSIPDGLFTDPEGDELTYSVQTEANGDQWIVTNKVSGYWEIMGVTHKRDTGSEYTQITLTARDSVGAKAAADIRVSTIEEGMFVTEGYDINLKALGVLKTPEAIVYLALTLGSIINDGNVLIHQAYMTSDGLAVEFGINRGQQQRCPRNQNALVLGELRKLKDKEIPIIGTNEQFVMPRLIYVIPVDPCQNSDPIVNTNLISKFKPLNIKLGELFESVLPVDLFTDYEDENLSRMNIELKVQGTDKSNGWITLDPKTRNILAFTLDNPDSEAQYSFVVRDSAGNSVEEEIDIEIVDRSEMEPATHVFTLTLNEEYSNFVANPWNQIDLYKKLNNAFPKSTVTIKSLSSGSVVVQFSVQNNEGTPSPPDQCPMDRIKTYKKAVFDGNKIKKSFSNNLGSYDLDKVDFVPLGSCIDQLQPQTAIKQTKKDVRSGETGNSKTPLIIGIVVVVLVLIIVIVIVVFCIRKRKGEKAKEAQNGSYIEKGVPVRLDEELKTIDKAENQPLMTSADVNYKPTRTPPAYPGEKQPDDYEPDTPPVSEPGDDDQRIIDRSL